MTKNEIAEVCSIFGEIFLSASKNLAKNENTCTITKPKEEKIIEDNKNDMKENYYYNTKSRKYNYDTKEKNITKIQKIIDKELKSINIELYKGIYIDKDILISINNDTKDIINLIKNLKYIKDEKIKTLICTIENNATNILSALQDLKKYSNTKAAK